MHVKNLFLISLCFLFSYESYSNVYLGIGYSYVIPIEELKNYNEKGNGFKLELTNKNYCKLWYGVNLDYLLLTQAKDAVNYYERIIGINAFVKYAPFTSDCFDNKIIPYLQGKLGFSSITPTEIFTNQGSNLGIGGALGLGVAYNFKLFKKCWMIELDGLLYAPNSLKRAEVRENLQSINVGLTLSMGL